MYKPKVPEDMKDVLEKYIEYVNQVVHFLQSDPAFRTALDEDETTEEDFVFGNDWNLEWHKQTLFVSFYVRGDHGDIPHSMFLSGPLLERLERHLEKSRRADDVQT